MSHVQTLLCLLYVLHTMQGVTSQISMVESGPETVKPAETLDMTCKVTGASLTDTAKIWSVQWVQQSEGKGLKWLGGIWHNAVTHYAQSLQGRLIISRDTSKGEVYLKLTGLKPEESGKYYCARDVDWGRFDIWGQGTVVTISSASNNEGTLLPLMPCCNVFKDEQKSTVGCLLKDAIPLPTSEIWKWETGDMNTGKANSFIINGYHAMASFRAVSNAEWKQQPLTCSIRDKKHKLTIPDCMGTVKYPHIEILLPQIDDSTEADIPLLCFLSDFTPKEIHVGWLQSGKEHDSQTKFKVLRDEDGLNFGTTKLSVSRKSWNSGDIYTCKVDIKGQILMHNISKYSDHTQIKFRSPRNEIMASCENKNNSTLICLVSDFWPHDASIAWLKNGQILQDKGKDFIAMLNRKNNMYFGKSAISVQWNEKDIYTCQITHQAQHYLMNITKCSACPNSFEDPVVDLTLPSSEDVLNANAKIICLIQVSNLNPSQVTLKFDDKIMKMTSVFAKADKLKDTYKVTYTVTKKELKEIRTVTCVVNRPCSTVPVEKSKGIDKIIEPRSPDIVTSFGASNMSTGSIPLLCIINNYWPQASKLVWLKNGKILDNKDNVFTSMKQENGMYSGSRLLNVPIESWNKDTYLCRVTHQKKDFTEAVKKPQEPDGDILKPSFRDLFLSNNATVSCRTNMVYADIQWIVNKNPRKAQTKKAEVIHNNTTWIQSTITISLAEWKEISTLFCKLNPAQENLQRKMTIVRTKHETKVPTIHLLSPDQETMVDNVLMLTCLVMDFYPEDLFVTWKINDSLNKEDNSNSSQVNCNHSIKQCSTISQLLIQKSEWLKGTTYSCIVAHISSYEYIIKNITGVPNKSEEAFVTLEPDIHKPSFNELLLSKNATVNCRTNVGINDISWLLNETEIATSRQRNDERMLYRDVESVHVTVQIPLEEWKRSSTQVCNQEFYNTTDPNMIKQPKVYLLPPVKESTEQEHQTLICLVNGFYPEDVLVTWKKNDTTVKQDFPQLKDVICDPQKQLCSYVSHLSISKEQWLGGMSYACLVAHFSSKYYISLNISKSNDGYLPTDIHTAYEDNGGEELQEAEEINNVWTTTSTFIVLFLVTLIYSSFVTCVKVK
ncbi:uncharacterized protein LOC120989007 isoform X4 [Bufo bufo]|uniref:uncharacterized protein LOC120989007 isoform X4 n=1 Tax=Bufo bufo TaxID=8384 RepID=UPI001ABE4572|nr:uncharacterized protein LOC120989007 isoform X4 [Bufo bufo]